MQGSALNSKLVRAKSRRFQIAVGVLCALSLLGAAFYQGRSYNRHLEQEDQRFAMLTRLRLTLSNVETELYLLGSDRHSVLQGQLGAQLDMLTRGVRDVLKDLPAHSEYVAEECEFILGIDTKVRSDEVLRLASEFSASSYETNIEDIRKICRTQPAANTPR